MDQPHTLDSSTAVSASDIDTVIPPPGSPRLANSVSPQHCPTCGGTGSNGSFIPSYIYALGRIEPRFPRLSVEKEFAQVIGRDKTSSLTDRQAMHTVLSKPENRYLVRQLCWVMTIGGLETYILVPRDTADTSLLIDSLRSNPSPLDLDCVIGVRGPIAPPEMCNGLMLPIVAFDQIYSFDRETLMKALPKQKASAKERTPAAEELFDRILQITDNAGATDEHRALNYLAVRYPRIYEAVADAHAKNEALTAVNVQPSPLSGTRKLVDVIFSFTNRATDVISKLSVRVDVTEEFPFLATKLSPYFDR